MNSWKDKFPKDLQEKIAEVDEMISGRLNEITEQELYNQQRVLELYRKHRVAEEDLVGSTGYGYDDVGRDKLEEIFAEYFKTEDALVRPQIVSGTHAIKTCLFGVMRPGDTLYYMTGMPYDTIQEVPETIPERSKSTICILNTRRCLKTVKLTMKAAENFLKNIRMSR